MKEKLRVLHLEDERLHAEITQALLADDGIEYDMLLVATQVAFAAALDAGPVDLILADFTLPEFDGMAALALVRESYPDLPFIFVTGTMGEEVAIDALRRGATDYILKGRLSRLAPAIRRALAETEARAERRRADEALCHAQKMEALGTLSGGIAHDFNNILTAIIGYGSLLEMRIDQKDSLRPFVEHILSAANRAATLTNALLTFGRKQNIEPRVVDLNSVVAEVEKLLLRLLREDIELRTTLAGAPCMVLADAGQIGQVLMNLATNARDAMPQGGTLALRIAMTSLDGDFVATHGNAAPGSYVLLTVTDTGAGMDAGTRNRIFEPFFTTKEVGQGTGLGLSMAYGIIKQHNGYITCYSEPGAGTTFRIYLPTNGGEGRKPGEGICT